MLVTPFRELGMSEPVRVGLILNPNSRANRRAPWLDQACDLLSQRRVFATHSLAEIPAAIEQLLFREKISVLAICGGDGTIHHTLHALLSIWQRSQRSSHSSFVLPPILLLRGGTLNIVARASRIEGSPERILHRFLRRYSQGHLGDLPLIEQRVMCVNSPSFGNRYGFIFGSALTARCLEIYEKRFGGGYLGLARFLEAAVRGYLLKTPLWQENKHLLEGPAGSVEIDGYLQTYLAVVAATVDIKILGGLISGLCVDPAASETMHVRLLDVRSPRDVIRNLPNLVFGQNNDQIQDFRFVRRLRLQGDFSIDGEVFRVSDACNETLSLSSPPWKLRLLSPFP